MLNKQISLKEKETSAALASELRKIGFEVTDKITVTIQKDGIVENALDIKLENYIKTETLTENINLTTAVNNGIDIAFDDIKTKLFIEKI